MHSGRDELATLRCPMGIAACVIGLAGFVCGAGWAGEGSKREQVLFEDGFVDRLAKGWTWEREDPEAWRVGDGVLGIRVQPGGMWGGGNNARNVLVRAIPETSAKTLAVEVTVSDQATGQYEQAGIAWYYDGGNMIKLVKECIQGKSNIVMGREQDDRARTINILPLDASPVELRLEVTGDEITGLFRPEGKGAWQKVGTCDLPVPAGGKPHVSLQAYNGPADAEHWARFSGFRILGMEKGVGEDRVQALIDQLEKECLEGPRRVPIIGREKAKRLAELVREAKPRLVVECGTALGYSGLWIARELDKAGQGKLITIEINADSAEKARANFDRAGFGDLVTVKVGDAKQVVKEIQDPVDFVLLDCNAPNYLPCLEGLEERLTDGAIVVADNAGISERQLGEYFKHVRSKHQSRTEWFDIRLPWATRDAMEVTIIRRPAKP